MENKIEDLIFENLSKKTNNTKKFNMDYEDAYSEQLPMYKDVKAPVKKCYNNEKSLQKMKEIPLQHNNISHILQKLDYQIVSQVAYDKSTIPEVEMLKCYHNKNNLMYIMLDVEGYLTNSINCVNIVKKENSSDLPLSLKESGLHIMSHNVDGLVFETQDALIVIMRDKKQEIIEQSYILSEKRTQKYLNIYPLMYFSKIEAYPQVSCEQCNDVSAQLSNSLYKEYCTRFNEMHKSLNNLHQVWESYIKLNHTYQSKLFHSLKTLHEYKKKPCNDDDLKEVIDKSIREKNMMLQDYLSMLHCITELQSSVNQVGYNVYLVEQKLKKNKDRVDKIEY
jgi:hypothetical protein